MSPDEQRALWARECSSSDANLDTFRFGDGGLRILSMNVFYGRTTDRAGGDARIDVSQYACLFRLGADVVALQECVLGPLPRGSRIKNTAESYTARSPHMKAWVSRFPESAFREWWPAMRKLARDHGYRFSLGCGPRASMYGQEFGNALFSRQQLPAHCMPALFSVSDFPGESENRSAIVARLPGLTLVNTHLSEKPSKHRSSGQSSQARMIAKILKRIDGGRALIVGDFNKSDPATVPPSLSKKFYKVAYDPAADSEPYDLLREHGFACLPNDRATAWNARHPDQACSNFMDARALRDAVAVVMPWNGRRVLSDHAALAITVAP